MTDDSISLPPKALVANWETLTRTFIRPESEEAKETLIKYMEQILFGLQEFLGEHVGITEEKSLKDLAELFSDVSLPQVPEKMLAEVITDLVQDIAPHAVNVASPYFVGHMTAAIPFFMVHLKTITAALNQNVVKLETSKVVSILEKQLLAKIHRLVYQQSEGFYDTHVQNTETALGCFTEDGTIANITALWVARNRLLGPKSGFEGIEKEGVVAAYRAYDIDRSVVLVSCLGHYSLQKAGGVLGIGNKNVVAIDVDSNYRLDMDHLRRTLDSLRREGRTKVVAIVGLVGATETGTIDPLQEIAELCSEQDIHFHADGAWGGPTLLSGKYKHLLDGIQHADSVTIDGHKQFYMPMGCGMVYFKEPTALDAIAYHSRYINRPGSVDLGIKSLSGSREANSLILDSALKIMGTNGYGLLIEHSIQVTREFAEEIQSRPDFELTSPQVLNILTYRFFPQALKQRLENEDGKGKKRLYEGLNDINITIQRNQREAGNSFVSRTTLKGTDDWPGDRVVLRVVIMNPMTDIDILREILDEQEGLYRLEKGEETFS